MEKTTEKCGACGSINTVRVKPEPQNESERRQVYFHCKHCKRMNRRDGSVVGFQKSVLNSQTMDDGDAGDPQFSVPEITAKNTSASHGEPHGDRGNSEGQEKVKTGKTLGQRCKAFAKWLWED